MPKLTIDNFTGGISFSDKLGKEGSYYLGEQADPLNVIGYLTAGASEAIIATSGGGVITNLIHSFTTDVKNNHLYAIEEGAEVHQLRYDSLALTNNAYFPHQINSTSTSIGEDVKMYTCNDTNSTPTNYLFYSWRNATDGDVGRVTLGATGAAVTFDDDFLSDSAQGSKTKLLKLVPHPMLEWQESGYLYIGNGRTLVSLDGATGNNGTMDDAAFELPSGWVITSLFDAGEYIGITAIHFTGDFPSTTGAPTRAAVFFWDGTSDQFNRKVMTPDAEINASYNLNGEFYIFGNDSRGKGTIRQWDGTRFRLVQPIIDNASATATKAPKGYGGVTEYRNCLIFPSLWNKIYLYGSVAPGLPKSLVNPWRTNVANGVFGAIAISTVYPVVSYKGGSTYYLVKYTGDSDVGFLWKSLYYEFDHKIRLNNIKLYHKTASNKDDDIKIEVDYAKSTTTVGTVSTGNITSLSCKKVPLCNAFRIIIDSDTVAGVDYAKIVVDYDYIEDPK